MPRFPTRTVILMLLALGAFVWMWIQTHRAAHGPTSSAPSSPPTLGATPVHIVPAGGDQ